MEPVRLAVVGAGHLGRIHARLATQLEDAQLVAVVDSNEAARTAVAADTGAEPLEDYRQIIGSVDAAIVATPTVTHRKIAGELLQAGIHTLVEKPIAADVQEADELVAIAQRSGAVLQVGHVERFNPALGRVLPELNEPKFISCTRISGYPFRSTDIGVVCDLMIHDLDVVLSLNRCQVAKVEAMGVAVLGKHEDAANARVTFENGCIVDLTASRLSYRAERSMQVWTPSTFASVDFGMRTTTVVRPSETILQRRFQVERLTPEEQNYYKQHFFEELLVKDAIEGAEGNALLEEQRDLVRSIRSGGSPRVTGSHGRDALALAEQILSAIEHHEWDGRADGRVGPMAALMPAPILRGPHWDLSPSRVDARREAG
ncbi:MAG: Gfo/Idh/MocA family oxidoreductase [Planctomycetales bacterium]|nr:Gfo/Idh/MocA family oxidoreductase [Planctomycetales bacterium]